MLVGGRSSRFGSDKALAVVDGQTLLARSVSVLRDAGINRLVYVGGWPRSDMDFEATHVEDDRAMPPSALRGVLATLNHAESIGESHRPNLVVVVGCDLPLLRPTTIQALLGAIGQSDVAVASTEREHWSCLVMQLHVAPILRAAHDAGAVAMHKAFAGLRVVRVPVDEREMTNANSPDVLSRIIADTESAHR